MKYKRYGKLLFSDWLRILLPILLLVCMSVLGAVLNLSAFMISIPLIYAMLFIAVIVFQVCEKFTISEGSIAVYKLLKKNNVELPDKMLLIVSHAEICPFLVATGPFRENGTKVLKNQYAISILRDTTIEEALSILRKSLFKKPTATNIRQIFYEYRYVYSFVFNNTLLQELIHNKEATIIIPKSLSAKISLNNITASNVYIDENY